jgi:phosphorylcholine metabolism protein LicD
MTFKRDGSKIDFLFYKKDEDLKDHYFLTLYYNKEAYSLITDRKAYDELGEIEYMGTKLQCPKDIERHLEHRYGDWKTPILRPAFSFQNYIDRDVMIKI